MRVTCPVHKIRATKSVGWYGTKYECSKCLSEGLSQEWALEYALPPEEVTVCIVTLNTFKFFKDCVTVAKKNTKIPFKFLVLDLGDDGTSYWCKEQGIEVYKHELPFYFSQSCNFISKYVTTPYALFLNPDTLPQPDWLEELMKEAKSSDADIVGARLMYPNGTIQSLSITWDANEDVPGDRFFLSRLLPEHMIPREALAVSGACMLVKTSSFKALGGFDEKYKNGYEDVDLCLEAGKKKMLVKVAGRAEITHYQGKTGGIHGDGIPTAMEFLSDNIKLLKKKWRKHEYTQKIYKNHGKWKERLLIGTPVTGNVRIEWVMARYGAIIPTNWSQASATPILPTSAPLEYLVPDAQNIIVRDALAGNYEWLLLLEQDDVIPADLFIKLNDYMRSEKYPVVSGLYFTKSVPPEPMIYKRGGFSYDKGWKMGQKVWCWGVPTGCLLIHCSILEKMWDESPEYDLWGQRVRRVFEAPSKVWYDPQFGNRGASGTSDLAWCDRVIKEHFFKKAGWIEYDGKPNPFLCDTSIFVKHIREDGEQFPLEVPKEFL